MFPNLLTVRAARGGRRLFSNDCHFVAINKDLKLSKKLPQLITKIFLTQRFYRKFITQLLQFNESVFDFIKSILKNSVYDPVVF